MPGRVEEEEKPRGTPAIPSPSASIILVSPTNNILLLSRLQTSSAFPSAHVFPGGNLEKSDGPLAADGVARHKDNLTYRTGAIRELFEESGILLARRNNQPSCPLLNVSPDERRQARHAIHNNKIRFDTWLHQQSASAVLDTAGLIPFSHWITPPNVKKRYTTQMYIYFIDIAEAHNDSIKAVSDEVETTAAEWLPAHEWLRKARTGEVILFPPQYLLLHLVSQCLDTPTPTTTSTSAQEIESRRSKLRDFISTGSPSWRDKYISPLGLSFGRKDGRAVLGLEKPGPELKGSGLSGEYDLVVLVRFNKEGPREVEVRWRKEVLEEERGEAKTYGVGTESLTGKGSKL